MSASRRGAKIGSTPPRLWHRERGAPRMAPMPQPPGAIGEAIGTIDTELVGDSNGAALALSAAPLSGPSAAVESCRTRSSRSLAPSAWTQTRSSVG